MLCQSQYRSSSFFLLGATVRRSEMNMRRLCEGRSARIVKKCEDAPILPVSCHDEPARAGRGHPILTGRVARRKPPAGGANA